MKIDLFVRSAGPYCICSVQNAGGEPDGVVWYELELVPCCDSTAAVGCLVAVHSAMGFLLVCLRANLV